MEVFIWKNPEIIWYFTKHEGGGVVEVELIAPPPTVDQFKGPYYWIKWLENLSNSFLSKYRLLYKKMG